jgi:plasmid stabilization system protein ParE
VIVRLSPEAEADLTEAFAWYRERGSRLGDEFIRSFDAIVEALRDHPEAFPEVHHGIRRALMGRFPYCVFYVLDADGAVVLGCLHARRNPTAWRRRSGA